MNEHNEVHSVATLELQRYLGLWYEIGRLPLRYEDDQAHNVTAHYSLSEDGTVLVDNRCLNNDSEPTQARGEGVPVPDEPGQLKVTFLPEALRWIPFTKADYWVLKINPDYRYALVGSPDHKFLWLLAREARIPEEISRDYLAEARAQGFELGDWIITPQSGARVTDAMLAD